MTLFKLLNDEGDEERVKLNLIIAAEEQGTLKRIETKDKIIFKGIIKVKRDFVDNYLKNLLEKN